MLKSLGLASAVFFAFHVQSFATISASIDVDPIDRTIPGVSYAPVLEKAASSVVGIGTTEFVEERSGGGPRSRMEEFLRRYYGLPEIEPEEEDLDDTPRERRRPTGAGSGVIVSPDGYIVTNHHVVNNEMGELVDEVVVTLSDGREFVAEIVGTDQRTDVGILKIEAEDLPALTISTQEDLRVGDVVFAIGNPLDTGIAVTQGIISATGRQDFQILGSGGYENFIQTDASINMGNSGGPLVDAQGRMIGINTAIISSTGGNIGIGLAIPSKIVLQIANNLASSGEVSRGFLGVLPEDLDNTLAESFGLENSNGALVARVTDDSPASEVGMKRGDIILKVNDQSISNAADLRLKVSFYPPGTEVRLLILRDGERLEQPIELGDLDEAIARMNGRSTGRWRGDDSEEAPVEPLEGIVLVAMDEEELEEIGIEGFSEGVLIEQVDIESPFARQLEAGMVILEWNRTPVGDAQAIADSMRDGVNRAYVFHETRFMYIAVRM
ncbi:MAG: trypsin-like peptidase domain-containing protein [Opitutales bacterium]